VPKQDHHDDPAAPKANSIVVAVTAAVRNNRGELLLIERTDNGLWALPDGAQDIGESVVQAAQREVQEETGLAVEITGLSGIYSDPGTSSPTTTAKCARNSPSALAAAIADMGPPPRITVVGCLSHASTGCETSRLPSRPWLTLAGEEEWVGSSPEGSGLRPSAQIPFLAIAQGDGS
jgi:ADP-ribose pyrophosphatase YjhB (NUDIX family)